MPLWSGNVVAVGGRGGGVGGCVAREIFPRAGSWRERGSCWQLRRVHLREALQRRGLHSVETWSAATTSPLRWWSVRAMNVEDQKQEPVEQDGVGGEFLEAERELQEANEAPAVVATGSVFGAVALITGTSVGAGILALPAITAPIGFLPTATTMGLSWAFLLLEALLLAEVNVELMKRREISFSASSSNKKKKTLQHSQVLSLRTMAEETMGSAGAGVTTAIYLLLSYTLLVAYISKSGEVLDLLLDGRGHGGSHHGMADAVFTLGLGGVLCGGGGKIADSVNQVLTVMLLGLFLLIVFGGASMADWTGLERVDWTHTPQTLPIIFLALVYHDLTPGKLSTSFVECGNTPFAIQKAPSFPGIYRIFWSREPNLWRPRILSLCVKFVCKFGV